jgi:hypothetical protein
MNRPAAQTQALNKVQLLLVKRQGVTGEAFERALRAEARAISPRSPTVELAMALPPAVMGLSTQGASGAGLAPIDAVLEISAAVDTSLNALALRFAGIGARLAALLDPTHSCVLAGTEHIVMPGNAPVVLYCPLRRLGHLSRAQFQDYWLNVHAEFGRFPGNRYRQYHCEEVATQAAAAMVGLAAGDFDGLAIAYFDDVAHLRATLASPDISKDAFADEQRFIAHSRSQFLPFAAVDFGAGQCESRT